MSFKYWKILLIIEFFWFLYSLNPTLRPPHLDLLPQALWSFSTQVGRGHSTMLHICPMCHRFILSRYVHHKTLCTSQHLTLSAFPLREFLIKTGDLFLFLGCGWLFLYCGVGPLCKVMSFDYTAVSTVTWLGWAAKSKNKKKTTIRLKVNIKGVEA